MSKMKEVLQELQELGLQRVEALEGYLRQLTLVNITPLSNEELARAFGTTENAILMIRGGIDSKPMSEILKELDDELS